jgi:hypothetical protein
MSILVNQAIFHLVPSVTNLGARDMYRFSFLILFLFEASLCGEPLREWKNVKGQVIKATLQDFQDEFAGQHKETGPVVKLEVNIPRGKTVEKEPSHKKVYDIPFPDFSNEDQQYILDWHWVRQRQVFFDSCLQVVQGVQRSIRTTRRTKDGEIPSPLTDRVYLRDGSEIDGVVKNSRFAIHTTYGEFDLELGRLAAIQFGDGLATHDVLTGVNNNRFSGFLSLPSTGDETEANFLAFETVNGVRNIRSEEVLRIIFQVREGELDALNLDTSISVRLRNDDYFDATVHGGQLPVGNRTIPVSEVKHVEFVGSQPAVVLKNGGREKLSFSEEDLPMKLDLGPELEIFHGHLERMNCDADFRPIGIVLKADSQRDAAISFEGDMPGRVRSPSSSSIFKETLQKDDRIVSVNGRIPEFPARGDDSYEQALDALFSKKKEPISHVELGVQRGKQFFFQITIVRKNGSGG